jgi:hypothetical protein
VRTAGSSAPPTRSVHWSLQVLALFTAGRVVSTLILLLAASRQGHSPWSGPAPGYGTFINYWDSGWYERIFTEGYPTELPVDADGTVLHNQWAFLPLYPALVRLLHALTGLGWGVLAPTVSLLAAAGAFLMLYRLFRCAADHRSSLAGVAVVSFAPVSAVLQVPYAESLHLLLLVTALYLVARGRYYAAMPVVLAMCLARPAGVPFAIMVGILFLRAVWQVHRQAPGGHGAERARGTILPLFLLGVVSSIGALAWPAIAWLATGRHDAYVATETAWRGGPLVPFVPWYHASAAALGPVAAVFVIAALLLGALGLLLVPEVRSVGPVMGAWCAGYLLYLAAFWDPQSSTWRILLPLVPLALAAATVRLGRTLWVLIPLSVVLQFFWVDWLWGWTPTTPTGDYPP